MAGRICPFTSTTIPAFAHNACDAAVAVWQQAEGSVRETFLDQRGLPVGNPAACFRFLIPPP